MLGAVKPVYRSLSRAQRQDSSIPAPAWSKLVLVAFYPLSKANETFFIIKIQNVFTIFYCPSEKCKDLYSGNCMLVSVSVVNFIHLLFSMCWTGQELVLLRRVFHAADLDNGRRDQSYRLPHLFWQKLVFTVQIGNHFFLHWFPVDNTV